MLLPDKVPFYKNPKYLGFFIVALGLLAVVLINQRGSKSKSELIAPRPAEPSQDSVAAENAEDISEPQTLTEEIELLARSVGRVTSSPLETQREIQTLAAAVTAADVVTLKGLILNLEKNGDVRSLAVDILAKSNGQGTVAALQEIALSPWPNNIPPRAQEFEQGLRAFAIEGLLEQEKGPQQKALKIIAEKSTVPFLVDRAQRALAHSQGKAAQSPEAQDNEALKKLLDR